MNTLVNSLAGAAQRTLEEETTAILQQLIQPDGYVGELFSISYSDALVQVHDFNRANVGGIPSLCFLVATRLRPGEKFDPNKEDSAVILLRVLESASLPNDQEAVRIREERARAASNAGAHWDEKEIMDFRLYQELSYAGLRCRILGTFFSEFDELGGRPKLKFGTDISNFYPNRGLKVYKPTNEALQTIVNYRDAAAAAGHALASQKVRVGTVRYASTNRQFQGIGNVEVSLAPTDLLAQKTAMFGMTRTGKSNTVKVVAKSIFDLRFVDKNARVGQLIFDPNGEYANENVQDKTALKNVWAATHGGDKADVVTYGLAPHPADPDRRIMKLNFFTDANLQTGKEIIDGALENFSKGTQYLRNFSDVKFEPVPELRVNGSAHIRQERQQLIYRALLVQAGFAPPQAMGSGRVKSAQGGSLFSQALLNAMRNCPDQDMLPDMTAAAASLSKASPSWGELADAFKNLWTFIDQGAASGYSTFNNTYRASSSGGENWHDATLERLLKMFDYPSGIRLLGSKAGAFHDPGLQHDFADEILADLNAGRLVIVDQTLGDPIQRISAAERVMWKLFQHNLDQFTNGKQPPEIMVFVEEAHNLLPAGGDVDQTRIWVRYAREGAKLRLGLVYSTQEPSGIHKSILKATYNWFISHLNNREETRVLRDYYDFEDFEESILRAQDRGFLRVKTLSNPFIVPTQIDRFELPAIVLGSGK